MNNNDALIYKKPEELLQKLIRFNTTNPPGNEIECISYIKGLLDSAGVETKMFGKTPERQNLYAVLKGCNNAAPMLMYGHADVVTTEGQKWTYPPFEGVIDQGYVWGRGAMDMKGALTMMICAMLRAKCEGMVPRGDVILCVLCDEEVDGSHGAWYMVDNYADLFSGVKYAIGEVGGATVYIDNKKFYPIMIAEKQACPLKAVITGPGGHGSMPMHGGAMAKLSKILDILDKKRLPVHITPPVRMMIEALSSNMSFPAGPMLKQLLNPAMTDRVLGLLGNSGKLFDPILHNTLNATIVRGGNKVNVIPTEITLGFDGRILPGYNSDDFISEVKTLIGEYAEIEVESYSPGPGKTEMGLYEKLAAIVKEGDTEGIPVPFVVSGVTDARFFAKLGIQTYGFTPMLLPKEIDLSKMMHAADERIPVKAVQFGADSIFKLIERL